MPSLPPCTTQLHLPFLLPRFPLKKITPTIPSAEHTAFAAEYLAQKYSAGQAPLVAGSGGAGRKLKADNRDDDLFWTQESQAAEGFNTELVKGGHGVPLSNYANARSSLPLAPPPSSSLPTCRSLSPVGTKWVRC